jgi:hypothetical protein
LFTWSSGAASGVAHHARVPQVGGGDQRRAVVAAGHLPGAGAQLQQQAQRVFIVGHGGDGHGVVAVVLQQVERRARLGQQAGRLALAREGGHVQRRAAVGVAHVHVGPGSRRCSPVVSPRAAAACRPW